jgi:hypothetical protein
MLAKNLFQRPNLLIKYSYITAYQIFSYCTLSRMAVFMCFSKVGEPET